VKDEETSDDTLREDKEICTYNRLLDYSFPIFFLDLHGYESIVTGKDCLPAGIASLGRTEGV
jgi:hypothetical protein